MVCECDRFESRRNFIGRNELGVLTPDRCDWYVLLLLVVDQSVSGCQGTSGVLAIEVTPGPSIASDFMDQEVCVGGTLQPWTVSYSDGTGNPSYQWYVNFSPTMMGASPIAGEVSDTYTPSSSVAGTFYYTCEISFDSGGCGEIYAPFVSVLVAPDPQITTQPLDGEEFRGGTHQSCI